MMKQLTQESQMNPNGNLWKIAEVKAITKKSLRLPICGGDGKIKPERCETLGTSCSHECEAGAVSRYI